MSPFLPHLAETIGEAKKRAEQGMMSYYRTIADMRSNYIQWLTRQGIELPARLGKTSSGEGLTFERVCREHAVVGDPDTAVAALKRLADETGATHILVWMNIGSTRHDLALESMKQFAREVMPELEQYRPGRRSSLGAVEASRGK